MKSNYVMDASALLALINAEPGHEKVAQYLPEACMSTVNVSEIASILHQISMPNSEIPVLLNGLIPKNIPFDAAQAYQTAQLRASTKRQGLSLGDRACLALGSLYNIPVITADKAWEQLDIGIQVILIR